MADEHSFDIVCDVDMQEVSTLSALTTEWQSAPLPH